jgi:WD40 repeat protein
LAVCPDGRHALSSGLDFSLRLWDLEAGTCTRVWKAGGPINSIAVDPEGAWTLLGAVRGVIWWDLETWNLRRPSPFWTRKGQITAVACAAATGMVLGASEDLAIYRWDLNTASPLDPLLGHRWTPSALAVEARGDVAVSGDTSGQLRLWDLETGACLRAWQGHAGSVTDLAISASGAFAASASRDRRIRIWDLPSAECARTLEGHTEPVTAVAVSAGGRELVSGGDDSLRIWDLDQPRRQRCLDDSPVAALALTPDGTWVVTSHVCDELWIRPIETLRQDRDGGES